MSLSEVWTRIYTKSDNSYDFDGDRFDEVINAIEDGVMFIRLTDKHGDRHAVIVSEIEAVALKTKDSMVEIWRESKEWEDFKRQVVGFSE